MTEEQKKKADELRRAAVKRMKEKIDSKGFLDKPASDDQYDSDDDLTPAEKLELETVEILIKPEKKFGVKRDSGTRQKKC